MINFSKVVDDLYRGGAPSLAEVKILKDQLGIERIVSLDEKAGEKISKLCKLLNIEHVKHYLNHSKKSFVELLHEDLRDLLLSKPTFIHCLHGKDRTGLVIAILKCKYLHKNCKDAIEDALSFGFGKGVELDLVNFYLNLIKKSCSQQHEHFDNQEIIKKITSDVNHSDIVENERSYKNISDLSGTYLDEANQKSFAPYLSETRQYPYDDPYGYRLDQYPTRENTNDLVYSQEPEPPSSSIPMVGQYDNTSGVKGVGPIENGSGYNGI